MKKIIALLAVVLIVSMVVVIANCKTVTKIERRGTATMLKYLINNSKDGV